VVELNREMQDELERVVNVRAKLLRDIEKLKRDLSALEVGVSEVNNLHRELRDMFIGQLYKDSKATNYDFWKSSRGLERLRVNVLYQQICIDSLSLRDTKFFEFHSNSILRGYGH
jgi:hypothetical protein